MRVQNTVHTDRPWRIHEIARGFRLEDVWVLPVKGGADDFPKLVHMLTAAKETEHPSFVVRTLFAVRWKLGELLGWDDPDDGVGKRVPTLRDRLPADLRESPGPRFAALPFTPLYLTDNEMAAETANQTMHGILHLGWVADDDDADADERGSYHGEMAVYVKPNGLFGELYMAAIKPFRYLLVYPAVMRQLERDWQQGEWVETPSV